MRSTTKNTQSKKLITKRDGAVILLIIIAAITALIFHLKKSNGNTAVITIDGQTQTTFKLADKTSPEGFELDGAVIELQHGKIRIKSSDCPNQICVHTGYISKKGEKIVCLPKRLVIEIE